MALDRSMLAQLFLIRKETPMTGGMMVHDTPAPNALGTTRSELESSGAITGFHRIVLSELTDNW